MKRTKRILTVLVIGLVLSSPCYAEWARTYDTVYTDEGYSIHETEDGGFIVSGTNGGFWILKLDSEGIIEWEETYRAGFSDKAYSAQPTQDGGYIVAGTSTSNSGLIPSIWILKLHSDGTVNWQNTYHAGTVPNDSRDHAYQIQETVDGSGVANGYIVLGTTNITNHDTWILRLDLDGVVLWDKGYNIYNGDGRSIQQTFDAQGNPDGYIVTGVTTYYDGLGDIWILKVNLAGDYRWHKVMASYGSA